MMRQIAGAFAEYEKALPSGKYQMHRRTLLKCGTALIAGADKAVARPAPVLLDDVGFMQLAINETAQAEFPCGAVIVKDGEVLARGYNRTRADRDPTAHGEMVAIRAFIAARARRA